MIYLHIIGMIIVSFYAAIKRFRGRKLRSIIMDVPQITMPLNGRVPSVKEVYKDFPESLYIYKHATIGLIIGELISFLVGVWILWVFDYEFYIKMIIIFAFYYIDYS